MAADLNAIRKTLIDALKAHEGALKVSAETDVKFEVIGTFEIMQGRQKVPGHYVASVIPKPKDIRLYFFPLYTHKDQMGELPEPINKMLKGKTCFHVKKMDADIEAKFKAMIDKGVALYKEDGLI